MKKTAEKSGAVRVITVLLALIALAALGLLIAALVKGSGKPDFSFLSGETKPSAEQFYFNSGRERLYAELDGGFAVVSTSGIQVFDSTGDETLDSTYIFKSPALSSCGEYGAAYDVGGTALCVFSSSGLCWSATVENGIIACGISADGRTAVASGESRYKTGVTVYDADGTAIYKWYCATGYIESAALSNDGGAIAVASLNESGTDVTFLTVSSEEALSSCLLDGVTALDIRLTGNERASLLTSDGLWIVSGGEAERAYELEGRILSGYSLGERFAAIYTRYYQVGNQGRVAVVSNDGKLLGELETSRELLSVSARGDAIAVLWSDGLTVYNSRLEEIGSVASAAGASRAIMRDDDSVLVISSHSAEIYAIG